MEDDCSEQSKIQTQPCSVNPIHYSSLYNADFLFS